jgi:hypothetical protein
MNANAILNADMTTVARWLRSGWQLWVDELGALLPAGLASPRVAAGGSAVFDPASGTLHELDRRPGRKSAPTLALLPADQCLRRTLDLPIVGTTDLRHMLTLDSDRVMPMAPGYAVLAFAVTGRDESAQRMTVDVAAMPRRHAEALGSAIAASGAPIRRVAIQEPDGGWSLKFDFLPALRTAGLIAPAAAGAARWWLIVAFLAALNIGVMIWRDAASVDRLQETADAQQPAVLVAQRIELGIQRSGRLARQSVARRDRHDAIGTIGLVTRLVPDTAWVQRYSWDGTTVRLTGYRSADTDVLAALRQSPRLADVHDAGDDTVADLPAGRPFDISASIRPR